MFRSSIGTFQFQFADLKTLLAKATPLRSGDQLAGVAAESGRERVAAQFCLADLPLDRFLKEEILPSEKDDVSALIQKQFDPVAFKKINHLTVGGLRDFILSEDCDTEFLTSIRYALTPEMVAAVSKIMSLQDLVLGAQKCRVVTKFRNTIGEKGRISVRLQPNHPTDDLTGVAASILDGLLLGAGDAVIGINPATDNLPTARKLLHLMDSIRTKYEIPTQSCVLCHVTTSMELMSENAPLDLVFQSIGGTQKLNESFGVNLGILKEAREQALSMNRYTVGNDVMYFETGQGSALSANAHFGIDQQTLETRAYAVAREFSPLLVNTVVGFIGPEYLFNGKQIIRAGLEDHFCGKIMGLPMGVDICYTNHADADSDDMDLLLTMLGVAGCNYIMGIPGSDDVMLSYQSTSFHDALYLRQSLNLKPAPEFEAWLQRMGVVGKNQLPTWKEDSMRLLPGFAGEFHGK
ncbi:ethanolamine ammonia lyase large subunit [Leptospira kobayashii]|uniref:Ethanolamine ammonia-lyase large subunit n=1 Tax=Leptospira kobayashii TaxID=1917830 RepID=A0ABM7UFZ8_9LEPT|nr:ethanolamine ammonia-lyase subunit EutB [Leptospira kobayashii]BDA77515.1 ethanolamine ammonia lyase large subunit [Leptospira kobayashii]